MLRQLPASRDRQLLVDATTADDAAVYRVDRHRALVLTVDFFTPIVDDPFCYGQIAAANALSDVYAMGGRPFAAMNLVGMPVDTLPPGIIRRILRGGATKVREAGCVLAGGHSLKTPEPLYGLSVTGWVHPRRMITNAAARPGDRLVLTKPLGTGIITTAIKRELAPTALARRATRLMAQLNTVGPIVAERHEVRAGTDVTGFGLLGHLASLCRASGVGAHLQASQIPAIGREVLRLIRAGCIPGGTRQNLETANEETRWRGVDEAGRFLLADAQTSGGLLLCVRPRHLEGVLQTLRAHRAPAAAVIGTVVASRKPWIVVDA